MAASGYVKRRSNGRPHECEACKPFSTGGVRLLAQDVRAAALMRSEDARTILLGVGQSPGIVLRALHDEVKLSDFVLGRVVARSAQTVRRWRREGDSVDVPDEAAAAIDDLRAITAMLFRAGFEGGTIKSFLLSRNTGLGQDRPLDGVRAGLDAFRRVARVTECFIAGIAPEPGSALAVRDGEEFEPVLADPPVEPQSPHEPVGAGRS